MKINKLFHAAAGVLAAASSAVAANLTWVGGNANSTWDTTATSNWGGSAWSNATPDSAIFGGAGESVTLGADITAQHLTFDAPGYSIGSGTLTLAGAAPTITTASGATAVISSNLAGNNGFTKDGAGTLTINTATANTLSGTITVNAGTLIFDYANSGGNTAKVATTSILALGGGTFHLKGAPARFTTVQKFAGLVIKPGSSNAVATLTGGATTGINYTTVTRTGIGGTVDFSGTGMNQTDGMTNTNGILGGYATFNGNTWAVGTATFGNITGFGSFSTNAMSDGTRNVDVTASFTATGSAANTLRFNHADAATLTLGDGAATTITSGGILVTPAVGNNAILITGGTSLAGAAGKDLIVHQNNTAGSLTIATPIVDKGGATGLTKSGTGTLILSGANTYTGVTSVNAGILSLTGETMIASGNNGVRIAPDATLAVSGTLKLLSGTSKIANSGTLDLTSGTAVLDLNEQVTGITEGATYKLFDKVGTISGKFKDIVGYTPDTSGLKAKFNNTDGVITFKKVPEPSTYGLIGAGALGVAALVRRRRRRAGRVVA